MNNGNQRNGNGNGTATAVRRNGNGARPRTSSPSPAEREPAPASVEALHWDALAPRATEALAQPLDPQLVSQRKGRAGRKFDYIEGHTAIDQANRIFGFGGWGYELVGDVSLRHIEKTDPDTGEVTRTAAYSAVVRVTVPGAPSRTDVGFQPVADESPEHHETAFKGAVTDALKRALRSFGDRFGNGLYGDQPTSGQRSRESQPEPQRRRQQSPQRESQPRAQRRVAQPASQPESNDERDARTLRGQLIELSLQQGFTEDQVQSAVRNKTGRELDQLGPAELNPLIASAADKLAQAQQSRAG
jgi:DNA repair and recombination protein RAD52